MRPISRSIGGDAGEIDMGAIIGPTSCGNVKPLKQVLSPIHHAVIVVFLLSCRVSCTAAGAGSRASFPKSTILRTRSSLMSNTDRRTFLQLMGVGGMTTLAALKADIAKAMAIPANNRTGTIQDVEHIVILMQENRPFDHHFGTLRGVRGFSDPRAVNINLPLKNGATAPASVFLQPAGAANEAAGYSVPAE